MEIEAGGPPPAKDLTRPALRLWRAKVKRAARGSACVRVVVVCLANQCRSPMGEYLLATKLQEARSEVEVSSAGLEAVPGLPATSGARRAMERRFGKDVLSRHKATHLSPALIAQSDLVLVMTRGQREFLRSEWAGVIDGVKDKVRTLGEYAGSPEVDVDDPVGGDDALYDKCLTLLDELTTKAAKKFRGA